MPRHHDEEAARDVYGELRALDSKIRVIAQRMMVIEKNEQIIGKTLITHNKNLKELAKRLGEGGGPGPGFSGDLLDEFKKALEENKATLGSVQKALKDYSERLAGLESQLGELKYVLDNINPVEYVKTDQVLDLIDERLGEKKS